LWLRLNPEGIEEMVDYVRYALRSVCEQLYRDEEGGERETDLQRIPSPRGV
jgi:hypothetical protein